MSLALWLAAWIGLHACGGPPEPPAVRLLSPEEGALHLEGTGLVAFARAVDPRFPSPELSATWTLDGVAICSGAVDALAETSCDFEIPSSDATLRVEVANPGGARAHAERQILVDPWGEPAFEWTSPRAGVPLYLDVQTWVRAALDHPHQAPATLSAELSIGDQAPTALTVRVGGGIEQRIEPPEGPLRLSLSVTDERGLQVERSLETVVFPTNTAPACAILSPEAGAIVDPDFGLFEAQVSDAELDVGSLRVVWTAERDGAIGHSTPDATGRARVHASFLSPGIQEIRLEVTDDRGAACEDAVTIEVEAVDP